MQFAKQVDVIGGDGGAGAAGEGGEGRKCRVEARHRERVGLRHEQQLPVHSLDEEQRVVVAACSAVRRRGGQVAILILNSGRS
jgi:hypothetical protein